MDPSYPSKNTDIPLHRRIAETLGQQVSSGKLRPGEKLPSERQIARQFRASRATVRTALQHLEQGGLISRRERRSAVVAIRRNVAPHLRIACGDNRLLNLVGRLGEMQLLPPRCQLQLFDLQQAGSLVKLVSQPATASDVLICDLAFVNYFRQEGGHYYPLPKSLVAEGQLFPGASSLCGQNEEYVAAPLGISPILLYFNREIFRIAEQEMPHAGWTWPQLQEKAQSLTGKGKYGFQFRPTFGHLSCLMAAHGAALYQSDGKVASRDSETFEAGVRFIHELLHVNQSAPILAKAEQINLFSQQRCAMALDGFEMLGRYREALGGNLGVSVLPGGSRRHNVLCGFGVVAMGGAENYQPVQDLIRSLLSLNNQRGLLQIGGALPVRAELLNLESLEGLGVPGEVAQILLQELHRSRGPQSPASLDVKGKVEDLFLELWLGLDDIDNICRRFRVI